MHQYCLRYAELNEFKYNPLKQHPFNSLSALRILLKEVSGNDQYQVIDAIFEEGWSLGKDLGYIRTLVSFLEKQSIKGKNLSKKIFDPNVKKLLINETNMAIDNGIFGVPTNIIEGNLFWGNDQMEHIEVFLAGKDPLDREKLHEQLIWPRAIDCKLFRKTDNINK